MILDQRRQPLELGAISDVLHLVVDVQVLVVVLNGRDVDFDIIRLL